MVGVFGWLCLVGVFGWVCLVGCVWCVRSWGLVMALVHGSRAPSDGHLDSSLRCTLKTFWPYDAEKVLQMSGCFRCTFWASYALSVLQMYFFGRCTLRACFRCTFLSVVRSERTSKERSKRTTRKTPVLQPCTVPYTYTMYFVTLHSTAKIQWTCQQPTHLEDPKTIQKKRKKILKKICKIFYFNLFLSGVGNRSNIKNPTFHGP